MPKKSDKPSAVISATEASRTFSTILDKVEQGHRFVIERHGKRICLIAPPPTSGRLASDCLALLQGRAPVVLDDRFGADLEAVIAGEPRDGRPWDS